MGTFARNKLIYDYIFFILILMFFISNSVFSKKKSECPKVKCLKKENNNNNCFEIFKEKDTNLDLDTYLIQVNTCLESKRCPLLYSALENYKLYENTNLKCELTEVKLVDGENCANDNECASNNCSIKDNQKYCVGKLLNEQCNNHFECKIGHACIVGRCQEQRKIGEQCYNSDDYQCINNSACDVTICIEYNSKENGYKTNKKEICKSNFIYKNSENSINYNVCDSFKLIEEKCDNENDDLCIIKFEYSNIELKSQLCQCKYDSKRSRFCANNENITKLAYVIDVHTTKRFNYDFELRNEIFGYEKLDSCIKNSLKAIYIAKDFIILALFISTFIFF